MPVDLFAETKVTATAEETAEYRARLGQEKRTRLGTTYTVIQLCGGDASPDPPLVELAIEDPQLQPPAPLLLTAKEVSETTKQADENVKVTPRTAPEPADTKESISETTIQTNSDPA